MGKRVSKQLNKQLQNAVKNFNAKIRRLENRGYSGYVPEKLKASSVSAAATSSRDIRKEIKEMERFTKRGSEEIITTRGGYKGSRYEIGKISREKQSAIRSVKKELAKLETTKIKNAGKIESVTYAQMGDEQYINLRKRLDALQSKPISRMTAEEVKRIQKLSQKTIDKFNPIKAAQFRQNYYKMLKDQAYIINYPEDAIDEIISRLNDLSDKELVDLFNSDKALKEIANQYSERKDQKIMNQEFQANYESRIEDLFDLLSLNIEEIIRNR